MNTKDISGYLYQDSGLNCSHNYLLPEITRILKSLNRKFLS